MGFSVFKIFKRLFGRKELRVLMVGPKSAGKSTILYKMKLGEIVTIVPAIGFNVETVEYKKISFTIWDVGGRDRTKSLWKAFTKDTQVLIYVVDSTDREGISDASEELQHVLHDLKKALLLVFANKQDLPNAMSVSEITDKLGLHELKKKRRWHIQSSCATSGDGLYEGLDWLSRNFKHRR